MERVDFLGTDISGVLDRLPDEARNRLPFGVVKLDPKGTILAYNMAEAEISGIHPDDVVGRNFFLDVAVCTQRPEFYGRFRDAMDTNKVLNLIFDYEFQNALYASVHEPIKVRIHMVSGLDAGKKVVWLMVKRVTKAARSQRPPVADVGAATLNGKSTNAMDVAALAILQAARSAQAAPAHSFAASTPRTATVRPASETEGADICIRFDDLRR